jgi:hypothetical protein
MATGCLQQSKYCCAQHCLIGPQDDDVRTACKLEREPMTRVSLEPSDQASGNIVIEEPSKNSYNRL